MKRVNETTIRIGTGCGNMYAIETNDNDFSVTLGKSGTCIKSFMEGTGKLIHLLFNVHAKAIKIEQMLKDGKIEIKGKEDRETMDRYLTRIRNMSSRERIVEELSALRCDKPGLSDGIETKSCMDSIAQAIKYKMDNIKEDK